MASNLDVLVSVREDDFIEYFLFPTIISDDSNKHEAPLKNLLEKINRITEKYTKDYIWQKDEFHLNVRLQNLQIFDGESNNRGNLPPHLHGITHYGDNISDEWFIVFLLMQITKEIDDLIARVIDVDGEFLLIEAADYLPNWATPEVSENRVYLYQGSVHVVPPEDCEEEDCSIQDAIEKIYQSPTSTLASSSIQNSILNKLKGYPENISMNFHRATAYVPLGVAAILKQKPKLIAPAIQAFCNRDSIDMKVCRAMRYFAPENRVYCPVTFTKLLYAMVTHSKYVPDRRIGWNLPPSTSSQFKFHDLGVKIASGFEILISQARTNDDVENDRSWQIYLKSLQQKGYFKNLIEHSRDYNNLLNEAKEYYTKNKQSMYSSSTIGQEVLEFAQSLEHNFDEFKKAEANLPPDDDDSWLNIDPKELEKMLQETYGKKEMVTVNNNTNPNTLTEKVSTFLNHISDLQGAEFPDCETKEEGIPARPPRGIRRKGTTKVSFSSDTKPDISVTKEKQKVNFDSNSFVCAVQNILDFMIPDDDSWNLESDSDMSDYGREEDINVEGCEDVKTKMQQYMEEMDKELSKTTLAQSFTGKSQNDTFDDIENFEPVDIDMNALKNILESYQAQMGEAGPVGNMLGPMGVHLDALSGKPKNGESN